MVRSAARRRSRAKPSPGRLQNRPLATAPRVFALKSPILPSLGARERRAPPADRAACWPPAPIPVCLPAVGGDGSERAAMVRSAARRVAHKPSYRGRLQNRSATLRIESNPASSSISLFRRARGARAGGGSSRLLAAGADSFLPAAVGGWQRAGGDGEVGGAAAVARKPSYRVDSKTARSQQHGPWGLISLAQRFALNDQRNRPAVKVLSGFR